MMNKNTKQDDYENCVKVIKGRHGTSIIQMLEKKKKKIPKKNLWAPSIGGPLTARLSKTPMLPLERLNPIGVSTRRPTK